jgi:hypothetical protein
MSILFATCFDSKSAYNNMLGATKVPIKEVNAPSIILDSINRHKAEVDTLFLQSHKIEAGLLADTINIHAKDTILQKIYKPDPSKAVWYSALCPGLGQLYNRRYWKLPIIGAGVVGLAYAISWNSKYYNAYTNAYRDISDNDPNTTSYLKLLPKGSSYDVTTLTTVLKNRQQAYRRTRDLSFVSAVGLYLLCLLDAYVDAQLYDFDISPDLSIIPQTSPPGFTRTNTFGLSLAFQF